MGLNVHTVQFKPDLYHPVCRRLRDYHPVIWDLNADLARHAAFPMSANGVDWSAMYDSWIRGLSTVDGLEDLFDVLNIHSYPFKDGWPTWRRSFPEDSSIGFLKQIDELIRWRDRHAASKPIWLTEFGYDSATKPPAADGPWAKWVGVSDELQARYIVRAFLVLSSMEIDRAYLYFFNDNDEAQLHGASGITRHFEPKPSFYAMSHLYQALGDFRFARAIVRKENDLYCFEYERAAHPREHIEVAWLASAETTPTRQHLPLGGTAKGIYRAERMATTAHGAAKADWQVDGEDVTLDVGPDPVFIWSR